MGVAINFCASYRLAAVRQRVKKRLYRVSFTTLPQANYPPDFANLAKALSLAAAMKSLVEAAVRELRQQRQAAPAA